MTLTGEMRVLLDGWTLVHQSGSSAALHLMTLLATKPEGVQYTLALPGPAPDWLSKDIQFIITPAANNAWGRLFWEQRVLPAIARRANADLLHLTTPTPPISPPLPVVLSPSEGSLHRSYGGLISRLRSALATVGMARLKAILWPSDLAQAAENLPVIALPPVVYPGFTLREYHAIELPEGVMLPENYVLFPEMAEDPDLSRLVDAWSWVHGSLGDDFPLLLAGLSGEQSKGVRDWLSKHEMQGWVQVLPSLSPLAAPVLYERSTAVFHMGSLPAWGNSARNALASGKPYVATLSAEMNAVVGPAAFLIPAGDGRALGAALVSVIVEESLAEQLSEAALQRSSAWEVEQFSTALQQAYSEILSP